MLAYVMGFKKATGTQSLLSVENQSSEYRRDSCDYGVVIPLFFKTPCILNVQHPSCWTCGKVYMGDNVK